MNFDFEGFKYVDVLTMSNSSIQISQYTKDKANRTRLAIESYYAQAILYQAEREQRFEKLERDMINEGIINYGINFDHYNIVARTIM